MLDHLIMMFSICEEVSNLKASESQGYVKSKSGKLLRSKRQH